MWNQCFEVKLNKKVKCGGARRFAEEVTFCRNLNRLLLFHKVCETKEAERPVEMLLFRVAPDHVYISFFTSVESNHISKWNKNVNKCEEVRRYVNWKQKFLAKCNPFRLYSLCSALTKHFVVLSLCFSLSLSLSLSVSLFVFRVLSRSKPISPSLRKGTNLPLRRRIM